MARLKHFDNLGTARFVTFSCFHYHRLLTDESAVIVFLSEVEKAREKYDLSILGYVIMPNHVHLVLNPHSEIQLGPAVGRIKSQSGKKIIGLWKKSRPSKLVKLAVIRDDKPRYAFWQRRCYDHNCRTVEAVREKINYCHMNPVKAGLVANPADWPWSSYNWYHGIKDSKDSIVAIDEIEL
ncbi:MAG: hypothetical protein GY841_18365 [FCB group bacterium]|nr:hypothetical protein [FCB group bacterium]